MSEQSVRDAARSGGVKLRRLLGGALLGAALAAAGCGEGADGGKELRCGAGTVEQDGACVASDGGSGGAGAGADGGTGGASGEAAAPKTCASIGEHGPEMVEVTASTGERFCIDSTYVSVAMYSEYLSAVESGTADRNGGPLWGEPDACVGNTLLVSENCGNWGLDDLERPDRIRSCVAPCDARSYCAWAGKRLCGLLPSATGAICTPPPTSDALATYLRQPLEFPASELLAACQSVFGEHQRLVEEKGCDASRARARSSGESECGFVGPLFDVIGGYEGTVAGGCESVSQDQNSGGQPATTVPAVVYQGILSGAPRCISNGVAGLIDDVNGITAIRCCADAPGGQP